MRVVFSINIVFTAFLFFIFLQSNYNESPNRLSSIEKKTNDNVFELSSFHNDTRTLQLACTTYSLPELSAASDADLKIAKKIGDNCAVVLTWWGATPTWCSYFKERSKVLFCGPYDNWGFMDSINDYSSWILGGDIFNKYILQYHSDWILRNKRGHQVKNKYIPTERAMDIGNLEYVDFWLSYFIHVPNEIYDNRWKGDYRERSWNLRFLDNYFIWAPWVLDSNPINPRSGKEFTQIDRENDSLKALKRLRINADELGIKLFANIWSDVDLNYFDRNIYKETMGYLDFVLFEEWTAKYGSNIPITENEWVRRVKVADDIIKHRRATPVVNTEYGNFWFAVSTLLLVIENGKGLIWLQNFPSDQIVNKIHSIELGKPIGNFIKLPSGLYSREWSHGKVIVNPKDKEKVHIQLNGQYKDIESGKEIKELVVRPKEGKILILK